MKFKLIGRWSLFIVLCLLFTVHCSLFTASAQTIDVTKLKNIRLKEYPVEGLMWKGETALNTNWNKITETPDGKIWFCGGDHWGSDQITGPWPKSDVYERPWGYGNTVICYYDPKQDKAFEAIELDRAGAIYSNAETPGYGKIHGNITSDSKGNIYFMGYMGLSYMHEFTAAYYPKSFQGGPFRKAVMVFAPDAGHTTRCGRPVSMLPKDGAS